MTAATARYRTDLVTSLLGIWFMVGLMLDAWAHNNLSNLETFFTPWHAVFYTGFVAIGGWIVWNTWAGIKDAAWNPGAMPRGYPPAVLALAGFAVAAVGDFLWHTIFGIEQNINILFSPTHLGLAASMMVIITTPLRSYLSNPASPAAPGFGRAFPALLSAALASTLVLLFLQYANALGYGPGGIVFTLEGSNHGEAGQLATQIAVTNLVLLVPLLLLARRMRLPLGAATLVYTLSAGLAAAITGFEHAELNAALVVAGVLVDVLSAVLRPSPSHALRIYLFAGLAPLVTWSLYLAGANLMFGGEVLVEPSARPESAIELWTGIPIVQALLGLLAAFLLVGRAVTPSPVAVVPTSDAQAHSSLNR